MGKNSNENFNEEKLELKEEEGINEEELEVKEQEGINEEQLEAKEQENTNEVEKNQHNENLEHKEKNVAYNELSAKIKLHFNDISNRVKTAYKSKNVIIGTCIVVASIFILIIGYNVSDTKAYNNINKYLNNTEQYDIQFVKNNIDKLLKNDKGENFNKLVNVALKSESNNLLREIINLAENKHINSIDYYSLLEIYLNNTNSKFNDILIKSIRSNDANKNEENFIKTQEQIINKNNEVFIGNYNKYVKYNLGSHDKIHKLEVDIRDLIKLNVNKKLEDEGFKSFIDNIDVDKVLNSIIISAKEYIESNEIDNAKTVLDIKSKFNLIGKEDIENQVSLVVQLIESIQIKIQLTNEKEQLVEKYNNSQETLEEKNEELNYANEQKNKAEGEISKYNSELEKIKPFTISGYIVGKTGTFDNKYIGRGEQYEVKYTSNIPFANQDKVDRFILSTIDTKYTTKGNFSLQVVYLGLEDATVKEEFGGFTQQWSHYCEYTGKVKSKTEENINNIQSNIDKQKEIIGRVDVINGEINEIKTFVENYDNILKDVEDKLINEDNKILDMKNKLEIK